MKTDKKKKSNQKRIVQQKLDQLSKLNEPMPPSGWVKAIRGSLGLSIRQLAERVGVGHGSINQLEKREPKKRVTLESIENAARAMDCKVVYAIVPQESGATLDDIIRNKAIAAASKILKEVSHTMKLEAQGTSDKQVQNEIKRIANQLIESGDNRIWDVETKGKKNV
ncbi:MAG: mobile mystery protein A [Deltaproteobacteria bacterium]|jgi:predicted DNA-binding mobile mystery protein A|nr:mobile mystery protein A [Deltaproteobacteria bacterium]